MFIGHTTRAGKQETLQAQAQAQVDGSPKVHGAQFHAPRNHFPSTPLLHSSKITTAAPAAWQCFAGERRAPRHQSRHTRVQHTTITEAPDAPRPSATHPVRGNSPGPGTAGKPGSAAGRGPAGQGSRALQAGTGMGGGLTNGWGMVWLRPCSNWACSRCCSEDVRTACGCRPPAPLHFIQIPALGPRRTLGVVDDDGAVKRVDQVISHLQVGNTGRGCGHGPFK